MIAADSAATDPDLAAAVIAAARRVLVTGLVAAPAEAAVAACDLAESVGAAIDPGSPETSRLIGPLVARIGAVTAAAEELRDRADLVAAWFCAPEATSLGFLRDRATHSAVGVPRRTIAVGPHDLPVPGTEHRHLVVPADAAVDLARLVEAAIRDVPIDTSAADPDTLAVARELAAAITSAGTVGFVSDWRDDALGLAAWSTTSLVRAISHVKPAFEVPLGERDDAAVAVCTWRYGASGAIVRADRDGGRFLPAEADAVRLIDRCETDCVVVVGEAPPEIRSAIDRSRGTIAVIHVPADVAKLRALRDRVRGPTGASA